MYSRLFKELSDQRNLKKAILSWKPWAYSDNLPVISKAQVDNQVNFVAQSCFVLPTLSTCLHPILVVSVEGICYKGACVILNCALVENNWSLLVTRPEKLCTDEKPTDGGNVQNSSLNTLYDPKWLISSQANLLFELNFKEALKFAIKKGNHCFL